MNLHHQNDDDDDDDDVSYREKELGSWEKFFLFVCLRNERIG